MHAPKDPTGLRMFRRVMQTFGLGRGSLAADGAAPIQTVQLLFIQTGETRDMVPLMQHYGFASRPHVGCDYAAVAIEGDPGKSVVVASNDQRYRLALEEGEAGIHDDQAQYVLIGRDVTTIKHKTGTVITANEDGSVTVAPASGIMHVTGKVMATGDVVANAGGELVSLLGHVHADSGGSGESGPPVPGT